MHRSRCTVPHLKLFVRFIIISPAYIYHPEFYSKELVDDNMICDETGCHYKS